MNTSAITAALPAQDVSRANSYARRVKGFGCRAIRIDGHDLGEIEKAFVDAAGADPPTVVLARTQRAAGSARSKTLKAGTEGSSRPRWPERAIVELGGELHVTVSGPLPSSGSVRAVPNSEVKLPRYQLGAKVATRLAYGQSLAALGTRSNVVALEVGADGPSQMALEDLAMMRAMHGPTVLYPSDATSTAYLVQQMAERSGIVYMRTTRGPYPVLYSPDEEFPIGGAKVVRSSPDDQVTLVGAGVTLHSCLDAADQLSREGTHARVIDLYSVKPIDTATLVAAASATEARMVVVEDHYPQGGLGGAVLKALNDAGHPVRFVHLAVSGLPGSGTARSLWRRPGSPLVMWPRPPLKSSGPETVA